MRLFAALVPPPDVLERARDRVARVMPVLEPQPVPLAKQSRRFGLRRPETGDEPSAQARLDLLAVDAIHLPIAKFGNLPLAEAMRLADALDEAASEWQSPRLHFAGGLGPEPDGEESVWVSLAGDLDALGAISRGVPRVAQGLQFFVDRRGFRPHVRMGTVNQRTTPEYLTEVQASLEEFESNAWWQTTITLMYPAELRPGQAPFKTFRDIPLGPAVPH
jgi:2'-5' RNA ligase